MRINYEFSNLLGTVYTQGNLIFSNDGSSLLSPVGNRIACYDFINSTSFVFPFEANKNIQHIALSPNGSLLLSVDVDGRALLIHTRRRVILHRISFKSSVTALSFSPCGKYFAVGLEHKNALQIWKTPSAYADLHEKKKDDKEDAIVDTLDFAPFGFYKTLMGHNAPITNITFSPYEKDDGDAVSLIVTSSKDLTVRVWTLHSVEGYRPCILAAHRDRVIGAWFDEKQPNTIYSVARDGCCFEWVAEKIPKQHDDTSSSENSESESETEDEDVVQFLPTVHRFRLKQKHFFDVKSDKHAVRVQSAAFRKSLLVVGFSNGVFGLYEMPDFNNIHTLSMSQSRIDTIAVSPLSTHLAFASQVSGQLLVWDWPAESYLLKQQSHTRPIESIAYSPDGRILVTGGKDGRVKIWNTQTGFCFVTFTDHLAAVTDITFSGSHRRGNKVVITASMDGTVRAFDLIRYRCFRTFTTPHPCQFTSVAVDPSGEVVAAASMDTFDVYIWNMQTGALLDVISGHEGPVSGLSFSPNTSGEVLLASSSWDHTVRVWDIFSRGGVKCVDTYMHKSEVLTCAFRPDGKEICSTSLDGLITTWPIADETATETTRRLEIEGRRDIAGGRLAGDLRSGKNSDNDKHFTTVCYSADGQFILTGGSAKYVCMYDGTTGVLLKRFQISRNHSLDGLLDKLNSKYMTEAGPLDLIEANADEMSDLEDRLRDRDDDLPGVKKQDPSLRNTRRRILSHCVRFSPTGRQWAAATTEGVVMYALDESFLFDPFDLDVDVTPASVREAVSNCRQDKNEPWSNPLIMAFRLNDPTLIQFVYECIPPAEIPFLVSSFPRLYLPQLLKTVALLLDSSLKGDEKSISKSPHLECHLRWLLSVLQSHGRFIRENMYQRDGMNVIFRALKKGIVNIQEALGKVCDDNKFTIEFLMDQMAMVKRELKRPFEETDDEHEAFESEAEAKEDLLVGEA